MSQIKLLIDASDKVPRLWRGRFVENVLDRLKGLDIINDEDIRAAIEQVSLLMLRPEMVEGE